MFVGWALHFVGATLEGSRDQLRRYIFNVNMKRGSPYVMRRSDISMASMQSRRPRTKGQKELQYQILFNWEKGERETD